MSTKPVTIAYLMSRFPKLTETFVLYEMLELRRLNFRVVVLPLRLEREVASHPEVSQMDGEVFAAPLLSLRTLAINLKWLVCHPIRTVSTAVRAAVGTISNPAFFMGAVLYFPKAVVFADTVQRLGISHVHAHFASHSAMAAWVMHQLCGVSYSFTAHGTDLHVCQLMLRQKAHDAAFAVTISDYNIRFIAERCGAATAQRFERLHCGADLSVFKPRAGERPQSGPLQILCVAAYREVKGHRVLVEACSQLRERGIDFRCRLIGYGPEEEAIALQIRHLGLEEFVILEGAQSRPQVIQHLGDADLLVLSSIQTRNGSREGIPVALMEGMACALPVVASRISGIPELVEEGVSGLLFAPGDSSAMADAMESLARDPQLRARMGRCARLRVEASFDLVKNAHALAERIREKLDT